MIEGRIAVGNTVALMVTCNYQAGGAINVAWLASLDLLSGIR